MSSSDRRRPTVRELKGTLTKAGLTTGDVVRVEEVGKDRVILTRFEQGFRMTREGGEQALLPRTVSVTRKEYDSKFIPTQKDVPSE